MILALLFVVAFLIPSYLVIAYYLALVVARLMGCRDQRLPTGSPKHSFLIVIPAHDEQLVIERTIRSCQMANYPRSLLDIVVVADNCLDRTAELARSLGVRVLERSDDTRPGKGHALAWAFHQLVSEPHDAYMVLDADCPLDRETLNVMDRSLQDGDHVLQANHSVSNADMSPISYAAGVGRTLEYDLFFAPKSRLGLSVLLVGTGMVFHRSVIEDLGWSSHSCAEDTEFTIDLVRRQQRIRFVSNAYVQCTSAETPTELKVQRTRWASGNLSLGCSDAAKLMWEGLRSGNLTTLDLGWTLLIISRPLVLLHLAIVQVLGLALYAWQPNQLTTTLCVASLLLLPLFGLYLTAGIWKLGLNPQRARHLLQTPAVVAGMALISMLALFGFRNLSWNRTPRR